MLEASLAIVSKYPNLVPTTILTTTIQSTIAKGCGLLNLTIPGRIKEMITAYKKCSPTKVSLTD